MYVWPYPFQQVTDCFDLSKGCSPDQWCEASLIRFIYQVLTCIQTDEANRMLKTFSASCPLSKPSKGCKTKPRVYQKVFLTWQDSA